MDTSNYYNDTSDYNPLFLAVHNGEINLLPSLFEEYSATETIHGKSLIDVAAARGHEKIVSLLIKQSVNLNIPLLISIKENQLTVFNLLLKQCNVNEKNCCDETLLHYAAANGRVECATILIELGASVNARDSKGKTPLYYALIEKVSVELAEILFKNGAILTDQDNKRWEPLSSAACSRNLKMVKLLMTNGCNIIDTEEPDQILYRSPLKSAVEIGRLDIVEYMLENGIKRDKTISEDGLNLLHLCTRPKRFKILKYLINVGVKTKDNFFIDNKSITPNYKTWRYLLTCRSKIDANTYFSETQLHWAVRAGELETVKRIVNEQANTVKSDSLACRLAVYIAAENGKEDILQVLLNAGYSTEGCFDEIGPLHVAATHDHPRVVEMLLKAGVDVNSTTVQHEYWRHAYSPLYFAVTALQSSVVKFLLKNGADPSKWYNEWNFFPLLYFPLTAIHYFKEDMTIDPLTVTNFVKIVNMLQKGEECDYLLEYAVELKVHSSEKNQNGTSILNLKGQTSYDYNSDNDVNTNTKKNTEFGELGSELVRCLLNHETDREIESSVSSNLKYLRKYSLEGLNTLLEYDDSKTCSGIRFGDFNACLKVDYKCQLILADYSRNVDDLIRVQFDTSSNFINKNTAVLKLIIARVVLLTNNNDPRVLEFCRRNKLLDWRQECEMQKLNMQKTQIADDFNVTFHDILIQPVDTIANYVTNEKFYNVIESSYDKFPAYSDFLKLHINKGITRKNLREECENLMYTLIKKNHKIRFSKAGLDQIFQYFSVVDLRRFSGAFI